MDFVKSSITDRCDGWFCPAVLPCLPASCSQEHRSQFLSLNRVNSLRPAEPLEFVDEWCGALSSHPALPVCTCVCVCVFDLKELKSCHARPNEATGDPSVHRSAHECEKQINCYSERGAAVRRKEPKVSGFLLKQQEKAVCWLLWITNVKSMLFCVWFCFTYQKLTVLEPKGS